MPSRASLFATRFGQKVDNPSLDSTTNQLKALVMEDFDEHAKQKEVNGLTARSIDSIRRDLRDLRKDIKEQKVFERLTSTGVQIKIQWGLLAAIALMSFKARG